MATWQLLLDWRRRRWVSTGNKGAIVGVVTFLERRLWGEELSCPQVEIVSADLAWQNLPELQILVFSLPLSRSPRLRPTTGGAHYLTGVPRKYLDRIFQPSLNISEDFLDIPLSWIRQTPFANSSRWPCNDAAPRIRFFLSGEAHKGDDAKCYNTLAPASR